MGNLARRMALPWLAAATLSGCAAHNPASWQQPTFIKPSPMKQRLAELPAPGQRIAVAVYGFTDQTGQFRHSDTVQTLSRAVTQGATSILIKTLQDTGNRAWFQVIERERLDNVLRERAVIREIVRATSARRRSTLRRFRRCCSPVCCSRAGSSAMIPIPRAAARVRASSALAAARNTAKTR